MSIIASPTKLKSGDWGARVQAAVSPGSIITIRTRAGKEWDARVSRVVWTDGRVSICATEVTDHHGHSIQSGASYLRGATAPGGRRCPECGDRECPKAWDISDLCEQD